MWCSIRNRVRSVIRPSSACKPGGDVVGGIDPLADVVQQGGQQKLLVVRPGVAGQLEHLQRVIQDVAFGVVLRRLLHRFQRQQEHAEERIRVIDAPSSASSSSRFRVGILLVQQLLQFADRRPLDRLAGDRTLEDVMGLVLGVDGQLEVEAVVDVDVREDAGLVVLDDLLAFQVELVALGFRAGR